MNRPPIDTETRKKILQSSDYCIYCSSKLVHTQKCIEHFLPFCINESASHRELNFFVSCRRCNAIKGKKFFKTFQEAREFILTRKEVLDKKDEVKSKTPIKPAIPLKPKTKYNGQGKWISPFEYAKRKGITPSSVYRQIREGRLEHKKITKTVERILVKNII